MARFPSGMRPSTLTERKEFYTKELDIQALARWMRGKERTVKFAVIPGRHSRICKPEFKKACDSVFVIDDWRDASDLRRWILLSLIHI